MENKKYVLVINPGSTSTKIAIYHGEECIEIENLSHSAEDIGKYSHICQQKDMRTEVILKWLENKGIKLDELKGVVGRGGLLRPMPGGTYKITLKMLDDLILGFQGQHASNLGGVIAFEIAEKLNIPSYIVDPVAVDEINDVARISGMEDITRRSLVHALNIKAVTRRVCERRGLEFNKANFVVAHLGGGITVSPVSGGKLLDCNNANEEGPFSPERTGGLPVGDLVNIAFSKKYTYQELKKKIAGKGGLVAYLGTNDGREVDKIIDNGDEKAELIFKAMAYQISKEIGAMATVLNGKVDAIILTGGVAYNKRITGWIRDSVEFIAPIELVPGEDEMLALAQGASRVLEGKELPKIYENEVNIV